jgi:hypothetical protein
VKAQNSTTTFFPLAFFFFLLFFLLSFSDEPRKLQVPPLWLTEFRVTNDGEQDCNDQPFFLAHSGDKGG